MRNETILVVEDDRGLRQAMIQLLRNAGYEVIAGEDYGAALQMVDRLGVDVLISDLRLSTRAPQPPLRNRGRRGRGPLKKLFVSKAPIPGRPPERDDTEVIGMPLDGDALLDKVRALLADRAA